MTSSIDPIRGVPLERRGKERRTSERRQPAAKAETAAQTLPVPVSPPQPDASVDPAAADAATAAQLLGQGGQKRGLRGGPPVLTGARAAYLEAEWSGPHDRRKPTGRITKTQI